MGTISEVTGDLFDPQWKFDAIGHGVNCKGMMGAGIAVAFRQKNPLMYEHYHAACQQNMLLPGQVIPWLAEDHWVYNIASQFNGGPCAKLTYLRAGLQYVRFHMEHVGTQSLGLPRIGAGIGGLTYEDVYDTVVEVFSGSSLDVTVVTL